MSITSLLALLSVFEEGLETWLKNLPKKAISQVELGKLIRRVGLLHRKLLETYDNTNP